MNLLMLSWVAAYLPEPRCQAAVCAAGKKGYYALWKSRISHNSSPINIYPEHTTILTTFTDPSDIENSTASIDGIEGDTNGSTASPLHNHFIRIYRSDGVNGGQACPPSTPLPVFISCNGRTSTHYGFMANCDEIQYLDLSGLTNVSVLGSGFLAVCSGLREINFKGLENVHTIGDGFLAECQSLTAISSFEPLSTNLSRIGDGFLVGCKGLKSVNFTAFRNNGRLCVLGAWFMKQCTGISSINFYGFHNITTLESGFLSGCTSLKTIDFSCLKKVTSVGEWFLAACSGLERVDFTGLENLLIIRDGFMQKCTALEHASFEAMSNVTSIGIGLLAQCTCLKNVNLTGLEKVTVIGSWFLAECPSLTAIDFSPLGNVTQFDQPGFLEGCTALGTVNLCPLVSLVNKMPL